MDVECISAPSGHLSEGNRRSLAVSGSEIGSVSRTPGSSRLSVDRFDPADSAPTSFADDSFSYSYSQPKCDVRDVRNYDTRITRNMIHVILIHVSSDEPEIDVPMRSSLTVAMLCRHFFFSESR